MKPYRINPTKTAKTLLPKTQPKLLPNTTQCKYWTLIPLPFRTQPNYVPNTTQWKRWTLLVPKFYHPRLNPYLYPSWPTVNTECSCQNYTTHRLLYCVKLLARFGMVASDNSQFISCLLANSFKKGNTRWKNKMIVHYCFYFILRNDIFYSRH